MEKNIYNNILDLAKKKGVSISRIEGDLGFANATLRGWTNYRAAENLKKVADYFGITIEELITGGDEDAETPTDN